MTHYHSNLRLTGLLPEEEEAWDALVATSPLGSIYHTLQWKRILETSFGFKAQYMTAHSEGVMIDGMPLFSVNKPILGEKLISIPHCGGHALFLSNDTAVHQQLYDKVADVAQQRDVRYLELRSNNDLKIPALEARQPVIFPIVPLLDPKENLARMSENHRRSIRRTTKENVSVDLARKYEDLRTFYDLMAAQSQRFGSPMFPFKYFDALWQEFKPGECMELLLVKHNGRVIGGGVFFIYKGKIMYKYGACEASSLNVRPFHAMLWRAIQLGFERGLTEMDLGAASIGDEGLLRFKRHWGADMHPAYFHYLEIKHSVPRVEDYFDSYGWQKEVWRRLPRGVVNQVGPRILEWVC